MKRNFSIAIAFFIGGIILAVAISFSAVWETYRGKRIENEVEKLKEEAEKIKSENNTISQRISYYSTPEFIERISKDKMNMQKSGENVIIVKQNRNSDEEIVENEAETLKPQENLPNHIKWWNIFFEYK